MEPLNEVTAMNHAVERILDTFNVGDVYTEDSDIEEGEEGLRSNNFFNKGQNRFLQYKERVKTASKNLSLQRRFEDHEGIRKSLLFLQNQMGKEIGHAQKVRTASKEPR